MSPVWNAVKYSGEHPVRFAEVYCSRLCKDLSAKRSASCLNCRNELNHKREYCSIRCFHIHRNKTRIENWLEGRWNGAGINGELSRTIRQHLLRQTKFKCSKCSWGEINPKSGLSGLTINHKDGNPVNHSHENLEVLCPNCHSLTPNYGALNLGNGRKYRKNQRKGVVQGDGDPLHGSLDGFDSHNLHQIKELH